jgi:hypothetical protein
VVVIIHPFVDRGPSGVHHYFGGQNITAAAQSHLDIVDEQ